jgi:diguanylate cyclase (GGDEF)-like protein/PAS domain S-box-containing protein
MPAPGPSDGASDARRFELAFRQAAIGMALVGLDGGWLQVNDALCAMLGYSRDELLALDLQQVTHPDDVGIGLEHVERLLAGAIDTYDLEKRYLRKDGGVVWALLTVSLVSGGDDRFFVSQIQDVSRRRSAESAELQRRASLDPLTDLLSRGHFSELAGRELRRRDRYELPLAVLVIDADHFKAINDLHGHAAGDQVLRGLGALLVGELRDTDLLGRWGGEEFVALLVGTDRAGAQCAAERIVERCGSTDIAHDGDALRITVSIGVTVCQPEDRDIELVVARADRAMYAAKAAGRNRVQVA